MFMPMMMGFMMGRMLGGGVGGGFPARPVYGDRNGYLHANGQNVGRVAPGTTSLGQNGITMRAVAAALAPAHTPAGVHNRWSVSPFQPYQLAGKSEALGFDWHSAPSPEDPAAGIGTKVRLAPDGRRSRSP